MEIERTNSLTVEDPISHKEISVLVHYGEIQNRNLHTENIRILDLTQIGNGKITNRFTKRQLKKIEKEIKYKLNH